MKIIQIFGGVFVFYDQLKKVCKEHNTTVTQLARDLGMSTGNVGRWKNGGTPSIAILKKISERFEVSIDSLLD